MINDHMVNLIINDARSFIVNSKEKYDAIILGSSPPLMSLALQLAQAGEKVLLFEILKNKKGNQLKASEILGLNRNTLRKKITELNIDLNLDKNKRS